MNDIRLTDLTIGYAGKVVAESLNAAFSAGALTCLLGRNGVGKSTLLRTVSGYLPSLKNSVFIGKTDVRKATRKELSHMVSIVLTQRPDVQNITVEQVVALGRAPYTNLWGKLTENDEKAIAEALAAVGMDALKDRPVNTLSDGEMQKTMIAKALAQQTPVIILDEPTAFLDYPSKVEIMELLSRLARQQGKTILLSTHEVELATRMADYLWEMTPNQLTLIENGKTTNTPR